MTVNHHTLKQVIVLCKAALPDAASLLKQIDMALGVWYAASDLGNVLPRNSIRKENQIQLAFTWSRQQEAGRVLTQAYVNSVIVYHHIVKRHLGHLDIQNITLNIHSTDDNILTDQMTKKWQVY